MTLWWLEPGWKDAICPSCGLNIWETGGDPDWGECYYCKTRHQKREPEGTLCDICGKHPAVSGANGYGVCSQECEHEAFRRES